MQRGSGRLVGIGSVAGIRGLPGHGAYCASKAAVISYCESLRGELRASGVRVVTIARLCGHAADAGKPYHAVSDDARSVCRARLPGHRNGSSYRVIPWQMGVAAKAAAPAAQPWFDRLLQGRPRKHRQPPSSMKKRAPAWSPAL